MQITVSLTLDLPTRADIDALEPVVLQAGRAAMVDAVRQACREYERQVTECPHCHSQALQREGTDSRVLLCSFGRVELNLHRLRCEDCGQRFRPADTLLAGLESGNVTNTLKQVCVLAGASWSYSLAASILHSLCGASISHEWIRKLTNEQGAKEKAELVRQAKEHLNLLDQPDQSATGDHPAELAVAEMDGGWVHSREQPNGMEGKVAVVMTQAEPGPTGRGAIVGRLYAGTFGDGEELGELAYACADKLGYEGARRQICLGDGANWIKAQAEMHFPWAVKLLDWAHLARYARRAVRATFPGKSQEHREERKRHYLSVRQELWAGDAQAALDELTSWRRPEPEVQIEALEETIGYIRGQEEWIGNYEVLQEQGYPIGSGAIERTVELAINRRLKGHGRRWCQQNADNVLTLRINILNTNVQSADIRAA